MMKTTLSTRFRAVLLLVLVASLGFSLGIITDRLLVAGPADPAEVVDPGVPADPVVRILRSDEGASAMASGTRFLFPFGPPEWFTQELGLTEEQNAEMERILAESQESLREVVGRFQPEMTAVIDRTRAEILEVLTDEQVTRWDALSEQRTRQLFRP